MPIFRRDGRSILFVHVPKTGGSSVERVFRDSGWSRHLLDGRMGPGTINHLRWCTPQHMHAAMLEANLRLDRFDLVFVLVRDPVARLCSEYLWRNRNRSPKVGQRPVERWARRALTAYERDPFVYDNHLRPQHEFLLPGAEVHRFEDGVDAALADLDARHRLGLVRDVPRVRDAADTSGHHSSDVEVSPGLEALVRDAYHRDYAELGYPLPGGG